MSPHVDIKEEMGQNHLPDMALKTGVCEAQERVKTDARDLPLVFVFPLLTVSASTGL